MRYREKRNMAHELSYLRHDSLLVERRTYRNALEDVGTAEHPHHANLCECAQIGCLINTYIARS